MGEIVSSMFGPTPMEIQQAQRQAAEEKAYRDSQMSRMQQSDYLMNRAGATFGGMLGDALGIQNPELAKAQQQQELEKQIDLSTPESIRASAKMFLDKGFRKEAFGLSQLAYKRESEILGNDVHKAQIEEYKARAQKELTPKTANLPQAVETAEYLASLDFPKGSAAWKEAVKNYKDFQPKDAAEKRSTFAQQLIDEGIQPGTPEFAQRMKQKNAADVAAKERVNIHLPPTDSKQPVMYLDDNNQPTWGTMAEAKGKRPVSFDPNAVAAIAAAKEGGKAGIDMSVKDYATATAASSAIPKVDALITQLEKGDVIAGTAADIRKGLAKATALIGGRDAAKKATDTEIADVMMGSEVFPLIQSLGIGARGMDTPAEREFLRKVLTGELGLEKDTLIKMSKMRRDTLKQTVSKWDNSVDSGSRDKFFSSTSIPKTKLGTQQINSEDKKALDWANKNPTDPRAIEIKRKLGV